MGVKIEAGEHWYMSKYMAVPGVEGGGIYGGFHSPDKPANGTVITKGFKDPSISFLLSATGITKPISLSTDIFATVLEIDKGPFTASSWETGIDTPIATGQVMEKGPIMKGNPGIVKYALIGHDATLQFNQEGNPNYLKFTNQVEFQGKMLIPSPSAGKQAKAVDEWSDEPEIGSFVPGNG